MSTRSGIAFQDKNGKIVGIYCHSDGYPSYVGRILNEHYTSVSKIKSLMKLGDLSFLDENIGVKHDFDDYKFFTERKQCRAYERDRNEKDCQAIIFESVAAFMEYFDGCGAEYFYVFNESFGAWMNVTLQKTSEIVEN